MSKPRMPRTSPPALETRRQPPIPGNETGAGGHTEKTLRIAGFAAVQALFEHAPERVLRLFYEDRMAPRVGDFCAHLAGSRRPYRRVDGEELARIAGTVLHGGIVAVAQPPPVLSFDPAAARRWAEAGEPLFILDGVGNPHNLGAIARTLAFLGYRRLVISGHAAQAGLSEAAHRVAEGGLESLRVYRAAPLPALLKRIAGSYRVVGTALGRGVPPEALGPDPRPVALVLGNEEDGLSSATLDACEALVSLPGSGAVQSLNVAATAAILAYALRPRAAPAARGPAARQRQPAQRGQPPRPEPAGGRGKPPARKPRPPR